jgi:hypothetical protein
MKKDGELEGKGGGGEEEAGDGRETKGECCGSRRASESAGVREGGREGGREGARGGREGGREGDVGGWVRPGDGAARWHIMMASRWREHPMLRMLRHKRHSVSSGTDEKHRTKPRHMVLPFDTPSQKARRASFRYSKPKGSKSILSILQAKWLEEHPFDTPSQMARRASFQ